MNKSEVTSPPTQEAFAAQPLLPFTDEETRSPDLSVVESIEQRRLHRSFAVSRTGNAAFAAIATPPVTGRNAEIRKLWSLQFERIIPESRLREAVAFVIHPWPDLDLHQQVLSDLIAELQPGMNASFPYFYEVAAERLSRISCVFNCHGYSGLFLFFQEKASLLERHADYVVRNPPDTQVEEPIWAVVKSPLGLLSFAPAPVVETAARAETCSSSHAIAAFATLDALIQSLTLRGEPTAAEIRTDLMLSELLLESRSRSLATLMKDALRQFDSRSRDILLLRSLSASPLTGAELAARWNLTRSRVGQIESKAVERLHRKIQLDFRRIARALRLALGGQPISVDSLHLLAERLSGDGDFSKEATHYLTRYTDIWDFRAGWAIDAQSKKAFEEAMTAAGELFEQTDVVHHTELERILNFFRSDADLRRYLHDIGLHFNGGYWTSSDTIRGRLATALRILNRPSTKEEIASVAGLTIDQVKTSIGSLPDVVRADRFRWGYKDWIPDPYEGIAEEIRRRIAQNGGSAPLEWVVSEIVSAFGVMEASVRAYASCEAFKIEGGQIRESAPAEFRPRSLHGDPLAARLGMFWAQRYQLQHRHFSGYSIGISFDIAFANGLRPGDSLQVHVDSSEHISTLIWRLHNLNRTVDLGRCSAYLRSAGFNAGDEVLIVAAREGVWFHRASHSALPLVTDHESRAENKTATDPLLDLLEPTQ